MTTTASSPRLLSTQDAATYSEWFARLTEPPLRVRLLHATATAGRSMTVGELTELLGISQSTCSHHVRKLADIGFLLLHKEGTATHVTVNPNCCTGLPHAADVVMGVLEARPCCPADVPADITVRALEPGDWTAVRRIYGEGIATGDATFETEVPSRKSLDAKRLPDHRWVAEIDRSEQRELLQRLQDLCRSTVQRQVSRCEQETQDREIHSRCDERSHPHWNAQPESKIQHVAEAEQEGQPDHGRHDHRDRTPGILQHTGNDSWRDRAEPENPDLRQSRTTYRDRHILDLKSRNGTHRLATEPA